MEPDGYVKSGIVERGPSEGARSVNTETGRPPRLFVVLSANFRSTHTAGNPDAPRSFAPPSTLASQFPIGAASRRE